jgi:hypothetical protein
MVRHAFLLLCVLGVVLPYSQLVAFLQRQGFDPSLFVEQLFANRISTFFGLDVMVSSVVLWVLVFSEGGRRHMKNLWIYVLCNLAVGVSLALPLFLYMREREAAGESTNR